MGEKVQKFQADFYKFLPLLGLEKLGVAKSRTEVTIYQIQYTYCSSQ